MVKLRLHVLLSLAALFLAATNQLFAVTAMPAIVADLGGFDRYTWPNVSYLLGGVIAMPLAARFANTFGYAWVVAGGLAIFLGGCLVVSFAPTMTHLTILRGLEGFGGGSIIAGCHISAVDELQPRDRGMFQSLIALVFGLAFVISLPLGGAITESIGWRWIFRVTLPAGLLILVMILWTRPAIPTRVSMVGATGTRSGVLRNSTAMLSTVASILTGFALYGSTFFLPLYFQSVAGTTAAGSGRLLVPMLLATIIAAVVSGALMSRTGLRDRTVLLINGLVMLVGATLLALMSSETAVLATIVYSFITGFGMGGILAAVTVVVQNALPTVMARSATAALQLGRTLGGLVGLWALGVTMSLRFRHRANALLAEWIAPVPRDAVALFSENPGALLGIGDPSAAIASLRPYVASDSQAETVFDLLRQAVNGAVIDVFTPCLIAIAGCVVVCLYLRASESGGALRGSGRSATETPSAPDR